jgi:hypothetical protein
MPHLAKRIRLIAVSQIVFMTFYFPVFLLDNTLTWHLVFAINAPSQEKNVVVTTVNIAPGHMHVASWMTIIAEVL